MIMSLNQVIVSCIAVLDLKIVEQEVMPELIILKKYVILYTKASIAMR